MKYSLENYAEALASVISEHGSGARRDVIVENFAALLERNGDDVHAGAIIRATERILRKKEGGHEVLLESARRISDQNLRSLSAAFAGQKDSVETLIDPDLVAGVRITVDHEREFDGTLKGKMDKMFGENH